MRLNVCVSEIAPFGPYAAVAKGKTTFDSDDSKGGLSARQDSGPTDTDLFPLIERHGFH